MASARVVDCPLPLAHVLYEEFKNVCEEHWSERDCFPYRNVLGGPLYVSTGTRQDIATSVQMFSKFQDNIDPCHWRMMQQAIRYLIGIKAYGFCLPSSEDPAVLTRAWSNMDWASDHRRERSCTTFVMQIKRRSIVCGPNLHSATAQSTADAEFTALATVLHDVAWLHKVLGEIGAPLEETTALLQNNQGCI